MSTLDEHPILGQLSERDRHLDSVTDLQAALNERRRIMIRDGRLTTAAAGIIGLPALFFLKPLPFYLVLGLLVFGLPLVWRNLMREAREFAMTDEEIRAVLDANRKAE